MYARRIYGLMVVGMMLLTTGCSTDDVVKETASEEAIAISFSCKQDDEEETNLSRRTQQQGVMNTEDLYATGFGVMASVTADKNPSMMYNQEVKFTFVGDMENPLKGYWSYYPLKYWPTSMTNLYFSAYAPYRELPIPEPAVGDPEPTGIIGISANNVVPYIVFRRCESPESNVDLLWYYDEPAGIPEKTATYAAGTQSMKMRHALARLEIKVALAAAPPSGTKVLIEQMTLTGKMAKTGRLSLSSQTTEGSGAAKKYYPDWSNQVFDKNGGGDDINHTFLTNNEDNNPESYGIIDAQVRYIDGMPYSWQPAGLRVYDADPEAEDDGFRNVLSTGDRPWYVYLIPQETLALTVKVKYHKITAGSDVTGIKTTTAETATISPLKGNTTYTLKLTLTGI